MKSFVQQPNGSNGLIRGYALLESAVNNRLNRVVTTSSFYSKAKVNREISLLISILIIISIACSIILHVGRLKDTAVHAKLSQLFLDANESFEHTFQFLSILPKKIKKIVNKSKQELIGNVDVNKRQTAVVNPKKVISLLAISDDCRVEQVSCLIDWKNPLTYLNQSAIGWCVIAFIGITIEDIVSSSKISNVFLRKEWLLFPMPIWVIVLFPLNFIFIISIQFLSPIRDHQVGFIAKVFNHIYQIIVVFCVTSLPLYIILHGVWIGVVFVSFPIRTIPSIVFISFLISGFRWILSNITIIVNTINEVHRKSLLKNMTMQLINETIEEQFPFTKGNTSAASDTPRYQGTSSMKLSSSGIIRKIFSRYKVLAGYVVLQLSTLATWIMSLIGLHVFTDTVQDVSNISDNPITTIIGALIVSKLFSDFMKMLSPQCTMRKSTYSLLNCKVAGVSQIGSDERCVACDEPLEPSLPTDTAAPLSDTVTDTQSPLKSPSLDNPSYMPSTPNIELKMATCPKCQQLQSVCTKAHSQLEAKVLIKSGTNKVIVILTEQLLNDIIIHDGGSLASCRSELLDLTNLKRRLLQATPFDMKFTEEKVISIERSTELAYEQVMYTEPTV